MEVHLRATGCHDMESHTVTCHATLPYATLPSLNPAIWDHTVLPATRHKWAHPALTESDRLLLDLPTREGWKAELI